MDKKRRVYFPVLEWFDEEENVKVQEYYWTTDKGYSYRQTALSNGVTFPEKRISEKELISAIDRYYNA